MGKIRDIALSLWHTFFFVCYMKEVSVEIDTLFPLTKDRSQSSSIKTQQQYTQRYSLLNKTVNQLQVGSVMYVNSHGQMVGV